MIISATARAKAHERVPDWLLGGVVRRRVLERLRDHEGWSAGILARELGASRTWVSEFFRALRDIDAIEPVQGHRWRLASHSPIADALCRLLDAAEPYADRSVERPPSRKN